MATRDSRGDERAMRVEMRCMRGMVDETIVQRRLAGRMTSSIREELRQTILKSMIAGDITSLSLVIDCPPRQPSTSQQSVVT